MSFEARWRGECDECEHPIEPGQEIRSTGERTYAHRWCPEEVARPSRFEGTSTEDMGY